jgi:hypothetical protein
MHKVITLAIASLALIACKDDVASRLAEIDYKRDARMAQVAQIDDEDEQVTFGVLVNMLHLIESGYADIRSPYEGATRYKQPALRRLGDYESASALAETFAGSLWANRSFAGSVRIEQPFDYPLPHTLTWDILTLADGTALAISTDYDPNATDIQAIDTQNEFRVIYDPSGALPDGASPPASISGTFNAPLTDAVLTAQFDASDTGETQTLGGFTVTLIEAGNHLAIVDIRMADGSSPTIDNDAIFVEATDATGAYLDSFASSWGNPEQLETANTIFDELIQAAVDGELGDLSEESLDAELLARTGLDKASSVYGVISFHGTVDTVEVTLLAPGEDVDGFTMDITLPTDEFSGLLDGPEIPEIAVNGSVYDHESIAFLANAPVDIDPADINTAIVVEKDGFRDLVRFEYPDVISNLFLDTFSRYDDDAEDQIVVTFEDASGNTINVTDEDAFEFTINRVEFDLALFPTAPARVSGQFPVKIMTDLTRETYDADTNPDAVTLFDNQVRVDRNQFRNWDSSYKLLARDQTGQLLNSLTVQQMPTTDDTRIQVYYFYGEVAEVELLKAGPTDTVIYNFDAAIATAH